MLFNLQSSIHRKSIKNRESLQINAINKDWRKIVLSHVKQTFDVTLCSHEKAHIEWYLVSPTKFCSSSSVMCRLLFACHIYNIHVYCIFLLHRYVILFLYDFLHIDRMRKTTLKHVTLTDVRHVWQRSHSRMMSSGNKAIQQTINFVNKINKIFNNTIIL